MDPKLERNLDLRQSFQNHQQIGGYKSQESGCTDSGEWKKRRGSHVTSSFKGQPGRGAYRKDWEGSFREVGRSSSKWVSWSPQEAKGRLCTQFRALDRSLRTVTGVCPSDYAILEKQNACFWRLFRKTTASPMKRDEKLTSSHFLSFTILGLSGN